MIAKGLGYVRAGAGTTGQLMAHVKYLLYRERGPTESSRTLFGPDGAVSNRQAAVRDLTQHFGRGIAYHKLVLSPKDDERARIDARGSEGWQDWTCTVMADLGARLGKDVYWVATKHANTKHPHVHVIVAGMGDTQPGRMGAAGKRGQHREVQLRKHDFRAIEHSGRVASGIRDRADVQQQLRLFYEQDHAQLAPERTPEHDQPDHGRTS